MRLAKGCESTRGASRSPGFISPQTFETPVPLVFVGSVRSQNLAYLRPFFPFSGGPQGCPEPKPRPILLSPAPLSGIINDMTFFKIALPLILLMRLTAEDTRVVSGTVRNQDGRPLAGAVVEMTNMDSQQVWSNVTKSDGTYRFAAVKFAQGYRLHANYQNYSGNVRHLSEYDWRPSAVINLRVDIDWRGNHR